MNSSLLLRAAFAGVFLTSVAAAQASFNEVEPNETKAQATANGIVTITAGDVLVGNTTGTSTTTAGAASADTWRLKTAALPLAIYRHTLSITTTGTAGHGGTIRGLNQTSGVGLPGTIGTTDTSVQSTTTVAPEARTNTWYGFGRGEELYYRVSGAAATTADYNATLTTTTVAPQVVPGTFISGSIRLQTAGQTTVDTDIALLDSNLVIIDDASNDDESVAEGGTGTTLQSMLTRNLAAGTYYLAVGRFNTASGDNSPATDDFRTGAVLDFADIILNTSTTTGPGDFDVLITDANGATPVTVVQPVERYSLVFVQFTVVDPVSTYCVTGSTVNGCLPVMNAFGTPSASAVSGFAISMVNADGLRNGGIVYALSPASIPFGTGTAVLCTGTPRKRLFSPLTMTTGTAGLCDGAISIDLSAFIAANPATLGAPFSGGDTIYLQGWYRDNGNGSKSTATSNGLSVTFVP